jgi:hypothetical protein
MFAGTRRLVKPVLLLLFLTWLKLCLAALSILPKKWHGNTCKAKNKNFCSSCIFYLKAKQKNEIKIYAIKM